MTSSSSCLCPLPWNHSYVEMNGDIKLCCVAKPPQRQRTLHNTKVSEFVESKYMAHIRKQMVLGMWPVECSGCKKEEAIGLPSHRTGIIERNRNAYDVLAQEPSEDKVQLTSLDLRISNECNFKCRSCSIGFSNAWRDDFKAIYPNHTPAVNVVNKLAIQGIEEEIEFWEQLNGEQLKNIKEWHFAGGEALLSDKHYQLLENIISLNAFDIKITYTTNFSILKFKHWDILEMLKPFKNVVFHLSLDGVGKKGEYIRKGLNWTRWLKNLHQVKETLPQAKLDIHFVVSIFNVLDLPWHIEQVEGVEQFRDPVTQQLNLGFTCLDSPSYLSIQVLSPELKLLAEQRLNAMICNPNTALNIQTALTGVISFLKHKNLHSSYYYEFLRVTKLLDSRRRESYQALFPELASMEQGDIVL